MEHQKIRQIELFGVERCQFEAGMEYILSLSLSLSLFCFTKIKKQYAAKKKQYAAKKKRVRSQEKPL